MGINENRTRERKAHTTRRLIRSFSPEAEALTGYRKSARAQKIAEGLLPPPVVLGGRASAFLSDELEAVVAARALGATDEDVRRIVIQLVAERASS